jgi:hypothetical protein
MSKKKLLEEAQIRRMFQLAGIPAIGEGFIGGKYANLVEEEAEDKEEDDKEEMKEAKCPHCDGDAPRSECSCGGAKNEGMKYSREEEEEEVSEGGMKYSREEEEGEEPAEMGAEEGAEDMGDMGDMGGEEPVADAEGGMSQDKVEAIVDAVLAGIEQETGVPLERVPGGGEADAGADEPAPEPEMSMGGEEEEGEEDLALEYSEKVIEEVSRRVARKLIQLTKNK